MHDIIASATELGKKIASHPRTRAFVAAARDASSDKDSQAILKEYQSCAERIRGLERDGKPIEPNDKRMLADLESKLASNEKIKAMMRCQADYLEMMNNVNRAIDAAAAAE